jgi:hypothetical protein
VTDTLKALAEFDSPKGQVDRAREHIDHLAGEIKAFFDTKPYAQVVEQDRDTGQSVYKVRLTAKLPGRLGPILKDATSNLRDALDHAVYAAAVCLGVPDPKATGFPFANDARHLEGELSTWKFEHVPKEIRPVLMSFKPYPAGNDLLVGLNRIRNPNTHRVIVPVGFATLGNQLTVSSGLIKGGMIGYSRWDATKNEIEFMRLSPGSHMHFSVTVSFDVTFGDVEFFKGKPLVGTLTDIAAEVGRIVGSIEAETVRIMRAAA